MAEPTAQRLVRLLGIVTYLDARGEHPQVSIDHLARQFGVSSAQIVKDIDQLWVSGTPGYFPDDLLDFDADYEAGVVTLTQARGIARPLRLGTREAVALITALRAMREALSGALDPSRAELIASALDKLVAATGEAAAQALDVRLTTSADAGTAAAVGQALTTGRQLWVRYVNAADVESERVLDPLRLRAEDESSYLVAWCTRAQDLRTFRLDRILEATVLETRAAAHAAARDVRFVPASDAELVHVVLESPARRLAEVLPVEEVIERDDGAFELTLRVSNPRWLRRTLLEHAAFVRAVDPPAVLDDLHAAARAALAAYE
ncbi:MAG: helix-turn-helix transcriptional regulator [Cellulomonadaceae bacterium]